MSSAEPAAAGRSGAAPSSAAPSNSTPYSAAQTRIVTAALDLFGRYGVSGTSLQMIADALGVTKAAVYHQFHTKEEIVVAAVEVELAHVVTALDAAERAGGREGREMALAHVIDDAVTRRRMIGTLQHDPVVARLLGEDETFQRFMRRLYRVLAGDATDDASRVRAAIIAAAIGGAVTHPFVADVDDDVLRSELRRQLGRFLDRPG